MPHTIIIRDENQCEVERYTRAGNEAYLMQTCEKSYPLLSELDTNSYDVFSHEDSAVLINEIMSVAANLTDMSAQAYLKRVCNMLEMVVDRSGWTITFTPFSPSDRYGK